MLANTEINLF